MMIVLAGTLMYVIEGGENGFDSIPIAIYWAVVTVTTVGYGDIAPVTATGKMLASVMMILGYAIIAVPTGLISVEFAKGNQEEGKDNICDNCKHNNRVGSIFCSQCGREMKQ
jgi:voltage-gated potassium channel